LFLSWLKEKVIAMDQFQENQSTEAIALDQFQENQSINFTKINTNKFDPISGTNQ